MQGHRLIRVLRPLIIVAILLGSRSIDAQTPPDASFPVTGTDFSGVNRFWGVAQMLVHDSEPSAAQWLSLLSAPGYRLVRRNMPDVRDDIDLALKPSRHGEFVRASAGDDDHALLLKHLALAWTRRVKLQAYQDSLARSAPVAEALTLAARFLPPGWTRNGAPPLVTFALFKDDGYSFPQGIVVDLLYARSAALGGTPLVRNLAHEFHHSFVNRMARATPAGDPEPDAAVAEALYSLRNEGLADLIDKPYPFHAAAPGLAGYAARYDTEYAATPVALRNLDALLGSLWRDTVPPDLEMRASMLFWSNGHPNGAYIAREILETFGVDSLFPSARDPAAFWRTFRWAELKRGHPDPLSPEAWHEMDRLDARYWR